MKKALWQDTFLVFAVLAFACLLLCGGSRLIASPDEPAELILPQESWLSASLTCPPPVQTEGLQEGRQQENRTAVVLIFADLQNVLQRQERQKA